jgi:hypothetical protein
MVDEASTVWAISWQFATEESEFWGVIAIFQMTGGNPLLVALVSDEKAAGQPLAAFRCQGTGIEEAMFWRDRQDHDGSSVQPAPSQPPSLPEAPPIKGDKDRCKQTSIGEQGARAGVRAVPRSICGWRDNSQNFKSRDPSMRTEEIW